MTNVFFFIQVAEKAPLAVLEQDDIAANADVISTNLQASNESLVRHFLKLFHCIKCISDGDCRRNGKSF